MAGLFSKIFKDSERREHPRFAITANMTISVPQYYNYNPDNAHSFAIRSGRLDIRNTHDENVKATVKNLSLGGAKVELSGCPVKTATLIDVYLPTLSDPIKAKTKVVWAQQAGTEKIYHIGLSFPSLKRQEQDALKNLIKYLSQTKTN